MRLRSSRAALAATTALLASSATAIELDVTSSSSITAAASEIVNSMMIWYTGNQTGQIPGLLPAPYYWWEAGSVFGTLIDYWYYTGDSTYNGVVTEGMLFQSSPTRDFMPANQTKDEGNDDQVYWGFAAMTAAEYKFPNPPSDQPQWLELAQGVWNSQQLRWDTSSCGGGLRWQIFTWNKGYNYKNSPSNAGFINLGARLYAYTGNQTYSDWTIKAWDWMTEIGLIGGNYGYSVYDGAVTTNNCSTVSDKVQWSYSAGMLLNTAAIMYNITGDQMWADRANGLWQASIVFFKGQILYEYACEPTNRCNVDQLSFKASFARFLAASTKWMPSLFDQFQPYFVASAKAAASQCTGTVAGLYGNACGTEWYNNGAWDGSYGFGQEISALETIQWHLIQSAPSPVTHNTGGISMGDPSAGTGGDNPSSDMQLGQITTASRAGAGILTAVFVVGWLGAIWWMFV